MVNYFETYLNTTYRQCRELTNFGDLDLIFKVKYTVALLKGQVLIFFFFFFFFFLLFHKSFVFSFAYNIS